MTEVRIALDLVTKGQHGNFMTRGGAMKEFARRKEIRQTVGSVVHHAVRAKLSAKLQVPFARRTLAVMPDKGELIRCSSGELDIGNLWLAMKEVIDGLADGLGLDDDRELQKRLVLSQQKVKRGRQGIIIGISF